MSAAATVLQPLESYTDEQLNEVIADIQNLLAKRKRERQEAARERARAILREAGLRSLEDRGESTPKRGPGRKPKT